MTLTLLHFFGLMYLVAGAALFISPATAKIAVDDLLKSKSLMFLGGMMAVVMGALLVSWHNTWNGLNEIIVSAIGWMALVKGFVYLAFPDHIDGMAKKFYKTETCIRTWGVIVLVIGGLLMALAKGMI